MSPYYHSIIERLPNGAPPFVDTRLAKCYIGRHSARSGPIYASSLMNKVAVVVDSIASLRAGLAQQHGIKIMPIVIEFDRKLYHDGVDLSVAEAYRMLRDKPDMFHASPASAGEYAEVFRQAARTTDQILCITLSSRLSSMFSMARLAIDQLNEQLPKVKIELFDSSSAASGEGLIVEKAAEAAAAGKDLAAVRAVAEDIAGRVHVIGVMETIRYVYRTGRISKWAARFGASLNIRPLFVIQDGRVKVIGIAKNQSNGLKRALRIMQRNIGDRPVHVGISHADAPAAGEALKKQIEASFNCKEVWLTDFSPVMAYATGAGVLAIGYYVD